MYTEYYFTALAVACLTLALIRYRIEIKHLREENEKAFDILNKIHCDFFKTK